MFQLRLLGGALIEGPDGPVAGRVSQRRQLALLAFLALQGSRPASRDKVLAVLWPESDTERARHSLADAVYVLRKGLGEESIASVGDDIALDSERVGSDVARFESALAAGDLEGAVAEYGGPLLDGFHLPDSREFEHWLERERERLARAHSRALAELAERCEAAGDWLGAVDTWRRLIAVEPHHARAAVGLMRALIASGDRAGAIRWAATHTVLLREEYGIGPDPELAILVAEARREGRAGAGTFGAAPGDAVPAAAPGDAVPAGGGSHARAGVPVTPAEAPVPAAADRGPDHSDPGSGASDTRPAAALTPSHSPAPGRRLRLYAALAAALAVVLVAAGLYMANGTPRGGTEQPPELEPTATAILPFRTAGADSALAYLREGMVDLMAAKLAGDGPVIAASAAAAAGAAAADPPGAARSAVAVARRHGAGSVIVGSVVGTPASLSLHATIVDAATGEERGSASVRGGESSLHELVDELVAQLLARRAGEAEHRLAHLTSTSLPALRAFLAGRSAHRRGDYEEALRQYVRALDHDSTFALAGLGVIQVSGWIGGSLPALIRGRAVARRHADRLSERDRVGLFRRVDPGDPAPSSVAELLESVEEALRRWPDHPVLWYARGDHLLHHGAALGVRDWPAQARQSFERAMELDPDYAEPVHHLTTLLATIGDTAALRAHAARQLDRVPAGPVADHLRWRARLAFGDASTFGEPVLDSMDTDATLRWIGIEAQDYGVAIDDGARAVQLRLRRPGIRDELFERRLGALSYALNQGRPAEAAAILESLREVQPDPRAHLRLALLVAMYGDGDEDAAARAAAALADGAAGGAPGRLNACVLGQWLLYTGSRHVPPAPGDEARVPSSREEICAAVLAAQQVAGAHAVRLDAGRSGSPAAGPATAVSAARAAIARLDSLLAAARHTGLVDDGHAEYAHLALARLLEAHGDPAGALTALRRRSHYNGWQPYLAAILREEGRLAAALGDTGGATRAWEHYIAFRRDPEPHLRAEADRVRAQLAELSGDSPR